MTTVCRYILIFFFYSAAGWLGESTYRSLGERRVINSGFLTGPMCPIYGTGAMVLTVFIYPFRNNLFIVFFLGLLLCDIVEYFTSFLMEKLFHARWWDYTDEFLNLHGRICLKHTCYWGIASVVFVKLVHPQTDKLFALIPEQSYVWITAVVMVIFLVDVANSVKNAMDIRKIHNKLKKLVKTLEQVPADIEEIASDLRLEIAKTSDKIADKSHDATVQILDLVSAIEQWLADKKQRSRFRLIFDNPGFRKSISAGLQKAKEAIENFGQNISNR